MPWSAWENGVNAGWQANPQAQQVSEPFKMFDNMYYVGTAEQFLPPDYDIAGSS